MNQEPDNYEDYRQNGGASAWLAISLIVNVLLWFVILMLI